MRLNKVSSSNQVKVAKIRVSYFDWRLSEKTSLEFSL